MRKVVVLFALVAALGSGTATGVVVEGQIAPDFTLPRYGGGTLNLRSDMAGKIVLLDFFTYWCGPCRVAASEIEPYVQEYYAALGGNPAGVAVEVLSISVDNSDMAQVANYISTYHLDPNKVILDTQGIFGTYGQNAIPQFQIINGLPQAECGTGGTNRPLQQWETVWEQLGYGSGLYWTMRSEIDSIRPIPEPATIGLLLGGLMFARRRLGR